MDNAKICNIFLIRKHVPLNLCNLYKLISHKNHTKGK